MKAKINILNHGLEARAMCESSRPVELAEVYGIPPTLDIYTSFTDPEDECFDVLVCFPPAIAEAGVDGVLLINHDTDRAYYNSFASRQNLLPGDSLNGSITGPLPPVELDMGAC